MFPVFWFDQCISLNACGFIVNTMSKDDSSSCDLTEEEEEHGWLMSSLFLSPHRVSPPHERGASRSGWVYLLTGHLWPGEQWLGQLLYQTGALRMVIGISKTDRHGIPPVRIVHMEPLMWREQYCYFVAVRAHNPKTFVIEVLKESAQSLAGVTHVGAFSL